MNHRHKDNALIPDPSQSEDMHMHIIQILIRLWSKWESITH